MWSLDIVQAPEGDWCSSMLRGVSYTVLLAWLLLAVAVGRLMAVVGDPLDDVAPPELLVPELGSGTGGAVWILGVPGLASGVAWYWESS